MGSGFFYFRLTTFYMTKYLAIAFLITGFPKCNGWGKVGELVTRTEKSRCGNFHSYNLPIRVCQTFKCQSWISKPCQESSITRLANLAHGQKKADAQICASVTQAEASGLLKVSDESIRSAKKVQSQGWLILNVETISMSEFRQPPKPKRQNF